MRSHWFVYIYFVLFIEVHRTFGKYEICDDLLDEVKECYHSNETLETALFRMLALVYKGKNVTVSCHCSNGTCSCGQPNYSSIAPTTDTAAISSQTSALLPSKTLTLLASLQTPTVIYTTVTLPTPSTTDTDGTGGTGGRVSTGGTGGTVSATGTAGTNALPHTTPIPRQNHELTEEQATKQDTDPEGTSRPEPGGGGGGYVRILIILLFVCALCGCGYLLYHNRARVRTWISWMPLFGNSNGQTRKYKPLPQSVQETVLHMD